jgi:hypothetical protein
MLADAHRAAAEDIEAAIVSLVASPRASRLIIEGAWGAAFHWIAFGCQTRHGKHQESHAKLGTFMRSLGETAAANDWERLDQVRQGGWYGSKTDPATQQAALDILQDIHLWATT